MKTLLSFSIIMVLTIAFFSGCKQDPSSSNILPMAAPPPTDAHPAWTFASTKTVTSHGVTTTYNTIAVSDSDGTDMAHVYTCAAGVSANTPRWSPSGGTVAFFEGKSIKLVDVTVTGGVASGSNVRTIYISQPSDNMTFRNVGMSWCPAVGVDKIAFMANVGASAPYENAVYTIPSGGGTPTKIFSVTPIAGKGTLHAGLSWSNDGTKLAFSEQDTSGTESLKVIDASGNVQATLLFTAPLISSAAIWSHTGMDKLAFSGYNTTSASYGIYTIGTTTGQTETLIIAPAGNTAGPMFWSPNNAEILYGVGVGSVLTAYKIDPVSGVNTSLGQIKFGDWKTP